MAFRSGPDDAVGAAVCLLRTTDDKGPGPSCIARSTDLGETWSRPAVFDDPGAWPRMPRLTDGVTLASSECNLPDTEGRPCKGMRGREVRTTSPRPKGRD